MTWQRILVIGCTLFTMLFGAGNIIFPLILGRALGTASPWAMLGFVLTGVLLPLVGFISIMLVRGDYVLFLKSLGRIPAFLVASLCMLLLGPLGAIPRCIALAHADLAWYFPSLPASVFSIGAALVVAFCTYTKTNMIALISRFLGPVKIISLLAIAVLGLAVSGEPQNLQIAPGESFTRGILGGYGTLDLLAILFFSQFIFRMLVPDEAELSQKVLLRNALLVSAVAGTLMICVYLGFAAVAVLHGSKVAGIADDTLLSALASVILGPKAGIFANLTIILACLTTAIALSASFADFLSRFIFKGKISYQTALLITIILSALCANLRFVGIMKTIMPIINLFYPALVVFAGLHLILLIQKKDSRLARIGFFATLALTALINVLGPTA